MFEDNRYVGKDIKAIREEIIEFIKEANKDWTDFNMSSIQLQYTEILAGVADMLCYYLDNQALETFLSTARQAKNIKSHLATLNYKVEPIGAAQGEVTFTRGIHEVDNDGNIVNYEEGRYLIPRFTKIKTSYDYGPQYVTLEERMMNDDINEVTVPVAQGRVVEMSVPQSSIKDSFKLYLTERPVPLKYVEICDESWEKVDDAFTEIEGGKKYSVHTDSKDMVYILFTHDWTRYLSDEKGATLSVRFIETDGEEGRVDPYELTQIKTPIKNIDTGEESTTLLTVINKEKTYGAFDKVNLNKQKANARNYLKTYDRIILLEDLETMVRKEPWIKDCVVYDWRKNDNIVRYPHQMKAWIITVDGIDVSGKQLKDLTDRLQRLTVPMTSVEILAAELVPLEFKIGIKLIGNNETIKENIRAKVEKTMNERYSFKSYLEDEDKSKLTFGMEIDPRRIEFEIAQLNSAIQDVYVELSETVKVSEVQFLNISKIKVYLI